MSWKYQINHMAKTSQNQNLKFILLTHVKFMIYNALLKNEM